MANKINGITRRATVRRKNGSTHLIVEKYTTTDKHTVEDTEIFSEKLSKVNMG